MSIATAAELVAALRQLQLLQPAQLDDLARKIDGKKIEVRALAQKLIEQGWLTPYQVNQLLQDRGQQLALGSYVLLERLGEGGMGEVFKARHQKLGRVVAIKLIRKERLANAAAVERFHREIRNAAQLSHPNVVHAFDADQVGTTHLFVMECVDGVDLNKLVKEKGPLPVEQACVCIRQAALGLQHAFEKGMVHRDIKPHNLLLTSTGAIKILDMGLARMQADEDASTLTQEGSVMGTLDYVSPEQAISAHTVDIRSDLYSLGCTFHFLLTGQVPFPGGAAMEKLSKHAFHEPTPVDQLRKDVPAGVAAVVRKLMAKKPDERFQTPAELAVALANGARVPAAASQTMPSRITRRLASAAALAKAPVGADETIAAGATPLEGNPAGRRRRLLLLGGLGCTLAGLLIAFLGIVLLSGNDRSKAQMTGASSTEPEKEIVNSIQMKLVLIPAGEFTMGSPQSEAGRETNEGPQHRVKFSKPIYMGAYEVTQDEYVKVMEKNPSGFKEDLRHPVENVAWSDAVAFCTKLTERPEEKKAGRSYRLPTDAEWEYACRAGTKTAFHYGDSLSVDQANFGGGKRGDRTSRVGSYPKNAWGLYDMHGNVWEWCLDDARTFTATAVEDPRGPEVLGGPRVLRGGGWNWPGLHCRGARRFPYSPSYRGANTGFRVVCLR